MKIVDIRERTASLGTVARNAAIGFAEMTASAVVIVTDVERDGRPLFGLGFDSAGRYGHGGLMRERFIPRLMAASPDAYAAQYEESIDPLRAWEVMMLGEKPGGHGDRAGAVGLLDAALWDLAAKTSGVPLWRMLADRFNDGRVQLRVPVYASGGHYREADDIERLATELAAARARGYRRFKIKIGGAPVDADRRRIERALGVVGDGSALAADGNGALDRDRAFAYAEMLADYELAWFEEPVDPLDYAALAELAKTCRIPIATGENLFSEADARNLIRHGGLRPDRDLLQFDVSLSYGIPEYLRIIETIETAGWARCRLLPHAGHLLAFHAAAGLCLGGHEVASDETSVFAAMAACMRLEDGCTVAGEAPGLGLETAPALAALFAGLLP